MISQNSKVFGSVNAERTKRSSNFSTKEVKFLIELVDNKKEIIESKKTDRVTSEEKAKAWMEIEGDFNAVFEDYRSFKVLKTKYENLKKNVKRKLPANTSNLSILKIMHASENPGTNEPLSDFDYDISGDESVWNDSMSSNIDTKPPPPLNKDELDTAAEEYVYETLLFREPHQNLQKMKQTAETNSLDEETIKHLMERNKSAVWEQVANKKLKKLEVEIKVIEEEWILRKHKLGLEVENLRIENRFKEEKLKLELELLKQKLENRNT